MIQSESQIVTLLLKSPIVSKWQGPSDGLRPCVDSSSPSATLLPRVPLPETPSHLEAWLALTSLGPLLKLEGPYFRPKYNSLNAPHSLLPTLFFSIALITIWYTFSYLSVHYLLSLELVPIQIATFESFVHCYILSSPNSTWHSQIYWVNEMQLKLLPQI